MTILLQEIANPQIAYLPVPQADLQYRRYFVQNQKSYFPQHPKIIGIIEFKIMNKGNRKKWQ